jgi:hypothetical protein
MLEILIEIHDGEARVASNHRGDSLVHFIDYDALDSATLADAREWEPQEFSGHHVALGEIDLAERLAHEAQAERVQALETA